MKARALANGVAVPVLGFGTWRLGGTMHPDRSDDSRIISILSNAIDLGFTHIDTAEMYGGGHTETLVGQAIRHHPRSHLQISTKVWQTHLSYREVQRALQGSLHRLGTDYVDFYGVHLPSAHIPLSETFLALNELVKNGQVRHLTVSNFTVEQLKQAQSHAQSPILISQAPCSLYRRKFLTGGLLKYCQSADLLMAAYSPFERGEVLDNPILIQIAERHSVTPAQVALNWIVRQANTMVYIASLNPAHLQDNVDALDLELNADDVQLLDELEMPEEKLWPQ